MASHRNRETLQPERVRIGGGSRVSSGGVRQPRQSWDVGQGRLSRVSKTPSKGGNNFGGRMSRTPLKHRPRMSSLAKGPESSASDPRDIKNKSFQSQAIGALSDFLHCKNFSQPLSRKILSSPSTKEFLAIFEFTVQCMLPGYEVNASGLKPDQEVFNMFRDLGYRYTLNKQHLATIGAPHTWPYALAALDWLRVEVELNDQADNSDDADNSNDCFNVNEEDDRKASGCHPNAGVQVLYRQNEVRLYTRYLDGEDDPDFSDFVAKLDEMMNGTPVDEKTLNAWRAECERMEEEISKRSRVGRDGPLQEVRRNLEAAEKEEAARQAERTALAAQMSEKRESIDATRRLREVALKERTVTEEVMREVFVQLSKQTVRKEDVHRILSQRQQQQQAMAYQERVKLDMMEACGDLERKIAGLIETCEPLAIGLRRQATELSLLEAFPALQIGSAQINNPDSFVPALRAALEEEEERLKKRLHEDRQNIKNEQKMADQVEDELRQASLKLREYKEQLDLVTNEVTSHSERLHALEETMMSERVAFDRKIFELRNRSTGSEKERQQLTEAVRLAGQELRSTKEIGAQKLKEKETICRALHATMQDLLQCSKDFGDFIRCVGMDFMPPEMMNK